MNNGKAVRVVVLLLFFFILSNSVIFASSAYVLPYPSTMPGSKFYKLRIILEQIEKYWYFGNLSQFKYSLSLSDRYLVEAKTLFEYNQFLLANNALKKSDDYFLKASHFLLQARDEGKNVSEVQTNFIFASQKHQEVLNSLEKELPEVYEWTPEKGNSSILKIKEDIDNSIKLRQI